MTCAIDVRVADHPDHLAIAGPPLPFADASFDLVLCQDVLEHVPPDGRAIACSTSCAACRAASSCSAAPFATPGVRDADAVLFALVQARHGYEHALLARASDARSPRSRRDRRAFRGGRGERRRAAERLPPVLEPDAGGELCCSRSPRSASATRADRRATTGRSPTGASPRIAICCRRLQAGATDWSPRGAASRQQRRRRRRGGAPRLRDAAALDDDPDARGDAGRARWRRAAPIVPPPRRGATRRRREPSAAERAPRRRGRALRAPRARPSALSRIRRVRRLMRAARRERARVSGRPRATVAIVNWNGRHLLAECLPSVFALDYPRADLECVVVDNGSTDGLARVVAARVARGPGRRAPRQSRVRRRRQRRRRGGDGRRGRVPRTTTAASMPRGCGILVDALACRRRGRGRQLHARLGRRAHRLRRRGDELPRPRQQSAAGAGPTSPGPADPEPALFACGGAMAVDRERFLAAGGFDPEYFAYFEDVDLGWRLWVLGERVLYVPAALAFHRHRGSGMDPARWRIAARAERPRDALQELRRRQPRGRAAGGPRAAHGTGRPGERRRRRALYRGRAGVRRQRSRPCGRRARTSRAAVAVRTTRSCRSFASRFARAPSGARTGRRNVGSSASMGSRASSGRPSSTAADGLGDFIDELEGRIEELDARPFRARAKAETIRRRCGATSRAWSGHDGDSWPHGRRPP